MGKGRSFIGVAHAVSRDIHTDITEGFFHLQLPRKSQLLASGGSSSSLTQSRLDFVSRPFSTAIAPIRLDYIALHHDVQPVQQCHACST